MNYLKKITIVLMASLLVWSPCSAIKTSEMPENSAPAVGDWLIVTDSAYTATQRATLQNLWEAVALDKGVYYSAGDIAAAVTSMS